MTTIEITDTHVKLLQAGRARGRRILTGCVIRPILDPAEEVLKGLIAEITASRGITSSNLMVVIPRRFAILKPMRLPSHQEREIKKMMGLQLVNQIPYSLDDMVGDYHLVEKDPSGYARILAVLVHKDVSRRYLRLFAHSGIRPEKFALSSFGLLGWLNYQTDEKKIARDEPVLLASLDSGYAEICFCHNRRLLFSRSVSYTSENPAQDTKDALVRQIDVSLKNYQKEGMGPAVRRIFIICALPQAAELKTPLEQALTIPVEVLSPLENILCSRKIDLSTFKEQPGLSLSVGLGFLLSDAKDPMNLIPPEVHDIKQSGMRKRRWLQCAALSFLIIALGLGLFGLEFSRRRSSLEELTKTLSGLEPRLKDIRRKQKLIEALDQEFQKRVFVAEVMDELIRLTPPDVSFRSVSLDEKGNFLMQGYAQAGTGVNSFQAALLKSPVFKEVSVEYITKRKIFNMEVVDFKITSRLREGP